MTIANRQLQTTTLEDIETRKNEYNAYLAATQRHIALGNALQTQGVELLKEIRQGLQETDGDTLIKTIAQITSLIDKGVKIERDARDKLQELLLVCPAD